MQGLEGGLHVLVDTLVADLRAQGVEVRTGARVRRLRPSAAGAAPTQPASVPGREALAAHDDDDATRTAPADAHAGGTEHTRVAADGPDGQTYDVELDDGTTLRSRRVVLASPVAADLLAEHAPGRTLPSLDAGAVVTLVTLVVDAPTLDGAPRGTGVLVAREASDVTAKALTHATAKWPWLARTVPTGRHVVRLSFGRAGDADRVPDDEDALVDLALRDASVLLGVRLDRSVLAGSAVVRWTQALPRPSAAHREAVAQVRAAAAALPGVAVCGAWTAGNGLASVIPDARAAATALVA